MTGINTNIVIAVFLGGGLGSALRYSISLIFAQIKTGFSPIGTLSANVLSCIIMAIALAVFDGRMDDSLWLKAFVLIGFCGGLSTFSTFSFETFTLLKTGQYTVALLNIFLSLVMCLMVFYFLLKKA